MNPAGKSFTVAYKVTYIWFWNFILVLNTLEQYLQQYFKKLGNRVKFWWWEFSWVGHQSGGKGWNPAIHGGEGGRLIFSRGWYSSRLCVFGYFVCLMSWMEKEKWSKSSILRYHLIISKWDLKWSDFEILKWSDYTSI